jgi:hypothetical protein
MAARAIPPIRLGLTGTGPAGEEPHRRLGIRTIPLWWPGIPATATTRAAPVHRPAEAP